MLVELLNLKIKKLTEDNGICLEQDMDAELRTIMNENNGAVCASNSRESLKLHVLEATVRFYAGKGC